MTDTKQTRYAARILKKNSSQIYHFLFNDTYRSCNYLVPYVLNFIINA